MHFEMVENVNRVIRNLESEQDLSPDERVLVDKQLKLLRSALKHDPMMAEKVAEMLGLLNDA